MAVKIKIVQTRKELKKFIRFANELYKENKYYTPILELDDLNAFNPKNNPSLNHCKYILYIAYKDRLVLFEYVAPGA